MPFDATPTITEADVLRRAKALIGRPESWCKGMFRTEMKYCARGAITNAVVDLEQMGAKRIAHLVPRAEQLLSRAIAKKNIEQWNDSPFTLHADVIAAFDRAIALAEAGEP